MQKNELLVCKKEVQDCFDTVKSAKVLYIPLKEYDRTKVDALSKKIWEKHEIAFADNIESNVVLDDQWYPFAAVLETENNKDLEIVKKELGTAKMKYFELEANKPDEMFINCLKKKKLLDMRKEW